MNGCFLFHQGESSNVVSAFAPRTWNPTINLSDLTILLIVTTGEPVEVNLPCGTHCPAPSPGTRTGWPCRTPSTPSPSCPSISTQGAAVPRPLALPSKPVS